MSLVVLEQKGLLKYLISQNLDGLHRRSGFNATKLSELHGNINLEYCKKCGQKYLRDFRTRNSLLVHDHETGRFCDNYQCNGVLLDTVINFGESLPEEDLKNAYKNTALADLCLVLGSSLVVQPAADLPELVVRNGQKLVIVNLQQTPLDKVATMKINGFCDIVLQGIMRQIAVKLQFYGHFKEPNLRIDVNVSELTSKEQNYFLEYDPYKQVWIINKNN